MSGVRVKDYLACSLAVLSMFLLASCSPQQTALEPLASVELGKIDADPSETNETESTDGSQSQEGESVALDPVSDDYAELEIEDQSGSGLEVSVEEASVSLGYGFLVVMNKAGEVLGYSVVSPDSQPVAVSLKNPLSSSQELIGELFFDNGDGVFSPGLDNPILNEEGESVREDFYYSLSS